MPEWLEKRKAVIVKVKKDARILTIDSLEDLIKLCDDYPGKVIDFLKTYRFIDWEKVSKNYDGVYLTEKGQMATRWSQPSLYGWDCESTLWFRDVFEKARLYNGELIRR